MFNREYLESVLPAGDKLDSAVARCLVECFDVQHREDAERLVKDLPGLLIVMGKFVEKDWHAAFRRDQDWQQSSDPNYENEWAYQISFRGIDYKPFSNYLTLEGWGTGTICWFVTVEYGWRAHITAEEPRLAVLRAIIVMSAALRSRKTRPSQRSEIEIAVQQIMEEGSDAAGTIQG